jgi:transposase
MGKRQFQLSDSEITALRQQEQQTRHASELRRLQAVRFYGSGLPVSQIMDMTGSAASSVHAWVQDYKRDGIAGLWVHYDRSAQNANKLSAEQRADLCERLHQSTPHQALAAIARISQGQFWTVSDLQIVVERWYGVVYEDSGSYRHLFHACGFSYQRTERVYKSRPSEADIAAFEAELEKK